MTLPPLIGKLEIRQAGSVWELWHLAPGRAVWERIGSGDEVTVREWYSSTVNQPNERQQDGLGTDGVSSRPSRAVAVAWDEEANDHGIPVWPQEPQSDLQAIMEAAPGQTPAETVAERQTREAAAEGRVTAILSALTPKQKAVAALLAAGWSQSDAAREMGVSRQAIEQTVRRIRAALDSPETIDIRFEVTPATHPERYYLHVGPPEPWCDFCTPPRMRTNHSRECAAKTRRVRLVRIPMGAQL